MTLVENMPDSHVLLTVRHVGIGTDIASAKDFQATFLREIASQGSPLVVASQ